MAFTQIIIVLAVVLSTLSTTVLGIKCFQCNSKVDPTCVHIPDNKGNSTSPFLKECTADDTKAAKSATRFFCRKLHQTVKLSGVQIVERTCGWIEYKKNASLCVKADTDFKLEQSCQCFSDACNSAYDKVVPVSVLATTTAGIVLLHNRFSALLR